MPLGDEESNAKRVFLFMTNSAMNLRNAVVTSGVSAHASRQSRITGKCVGYSQSNSRPAWQLAQSLSAVQVKQQATQCCTSFKLPHLHCLTNSALQDINQTACVAVSCMSVSHAESVRLQGMPCVTTSFVGRTICPAAVGSHSYASEVSEDANHCCLRHRLPQCSSP